MKLYQKFIATSLLLCSFSVSAASVEAMFSPREGEAAFQKMYDLIRNAKETVRLTVYSWTDSGLDQAISDALDRSVDVKIVLHPPLARKATMLSRYKDLEIKGAQIKAATQNMHEKFIIIDGKTLVNSSANMSTSAKKKYSENFIFHYGELDQRLDKLLMEFSHEFSVIWNTAADIITHGEGLTSRLDYKKFDGNRVANLPEYGEVPFVSSSMNFTIAKNKPTTNNFKRGKHDKLKRRGGVKNQSWLIRDLMIESINNANKQILVSVNHFNIREVSDALIEAVKRGVDVRLAVDNQEYKSKPNNKEMTPQFVKDWKLLSGNKRKSPPVRVKYYSHAPSPRYWLLNHHKFLLIDYKKSGKDTVLISGSYNISKNAEHKQFDNMVVYQGRHNKELFRQFYDEFNYLWNLNVDRKDELLDKFLTPNNETSYRIHGKEAVSLSWKEVTSLRRSVAKKAKGMFRNLYKHRNCKYYNPTKKIFENWDFNAKALVQCKQ